jgi:hypothetical protein
MRKTKYTSKQREAAITACEQSGLNRAEWCRQNKIPYNRYVWWLKSKSKVEHHEPAFVQIKTASVLTMGAPIEIHIREHIRITVPDAKTLESILPGLLSI